MPEKIPQTVLSALQVLHAELGDLQVKAPLGGSCGLLLQDVFISSTPRDIDLYADAHWAAQIDEKLRKYALDRPEHNESGLYRSVLSHYRIGGTIIELVGDFRVQSGGSVYQVRLEEGLSAFCAQVTVAEMDWTIMPLAHELLFNLLRGRPDRYGPIASAMRDHWSAHREAIRWIIAQHRLSSSHLKQLNELLPGLEGVCGDAERSFFAGQ